MNYEEKLIDYLYGEMSATEKQAFELELQQNSALQKELEELQASRTFLEDLPEVQPPSTLVALKPPPSKWKKWLLPASIAASFLILLDVFNVQLVRNANGIALSYGTTERVQETTPPAYATIADVQQLLENREMAYRQELLWRDSLWQNNLIAQEKALQQRFQWQLTHYQNKQQKELEGLAQSLRQKDFPEIANLVQNLLNEHQAETRILFNQTWETWQTTRTQDLNSIKSEFANVYQNQTETDALLLNVIHAGDD